MRAVSKADYAKGGNIPSYEVLKVVTECGEFNPDEMYFHDYDEDTEYMCWEERRYDVAKSAMQAIISNPTDFKLKDNEYTKERKLFAWEVAKVAVQYADALIAELKKTNETK